MFKSIIVTIFALMLTACGPEKDYLKEASLKCGASGGVHHIEENLIGNNYAVCKDGFTRMLRGSYSVLDENVPQ